MRLLNCKRIGVASIVVLLAILVTAADAPKKENDVVVLASEFDPSSVVVVSSEGRTWVRVLFRNTGVQQASGDKSFKDVRRVRIVNRDVVITETEATGFTKLSHHGKRNGLNLWVESLDEARRVAVALRQQK